MTLRTQLLWLVAVPALLVGAAAAWTFTVRMRPVLVERLLHERHHAERTRVAWIEDFIRRRLEEVRELAALPVVRGGDAEAALEALAAEHARRDHLFEAFYWNELDGAVVGTDGERFSVADRAYFPRLRGGEEVLTTLAESRASGEAIVLALVPVWDGAGRHVGAVGGTIIVESLIADARRTAPEPGFALVLDEHGEVLAACPAARLGPMEELARVVREIPDGEQPAVAELPDGRRVLVTRTTVPLLDWRLATVAPAEAVLAPAREALFAALGVVLAIVLLSVGVAVLLARRVTRPIARLREAIGGFAIGAGHRARVPVEGDDEIAELGRSFNAMQRRLEEEELSRQAAERALQHSQRRESLGLMAGGLAHEINNLLTVIHGAADGLGPGAADHERVRVARTIEQAVHRGATLTRRLLGLSRERPLDLRPVDLRELVLGLDDVLAASLPENVRFRIEAGDDPCPARVDAGQIEQVLLNLVLNARDALGPEGGRIDLRVDAVDVDVAYARLSGGLLPGPHARIVCRDDGCGMTPETLARAREPLFTTKGHREGSGLGLAVSDQIVRDHGGDLELDSVAEQGTIVTVLLPLTEERSADPDAYRAPLPALAGLRVAVCEDQEQVRLVIRSALAERGCEVLEFPSGEELLRWASEGGGRIDVLICDVVLPGWSGPETARRLRAAGFGAAVVYTSGYGREAVEEERAVVLPKPFVLADLFAAVAEAGNGRPAART